MEAATPGVPLAVQHLTKSRYMAGLQCPRRLWLLVHEPPPYDDPVPGSPLATGQEIGRKAHLLFPGGMLVDEEPWRHAQAAVQTAELMDDECVPAIFDAAFEYDGVRVRIDVLERLGNGTWGLREVKSSTRLKDHYIDDIALQAFVLNGAGVALGSIELLHVNNTYMRGNDGICWPEFFARLDLGGLLTEALVAVPDRLSAMRDCLNMAVLPHAESGNQCNTPSGCEFWDRCTADKPADWIFRLPGLRQARRDELATRGIEAISAIPADFPLTWKQAIIRDTTASGRPYIAPDLARLLHGFAPPACYLDFEAMMPPIPLYVGTRPYQTILFQWSLHTIDSDGTLEHQEFLAPSDTDPRRQFAETLITALDAAGGPIVVYSAYERTQLRALAADFADLRPAIETIVARLLDLLPVVRRAVYLAGFGFSNSIKAVAPALCPDFGYDDLGDIADGMAASAAFLQLASGYLPIPEEVHRLRSALLAYCQRDTLAMVEVHRALTRLAVQ